MQTRCLVALLVMAGAALAQPPVVVKSDIGRVTVYADRARVERAAALPLAAGRQEFVFAELPGWIDEESVRLALLPAGAGKIVDVRVAREHLAHSSDAEVRKAAAAVQETTDALADIESYRSEYSLEYPGQILLRARQNMDSNGLPAAPAAPAEDLIRKLEATF